MSMVNNNTTLGISSFGSGTITTTGSNITVDSFWSTPRPLSYTEMFGQELERNPLLKEGFKAMFSSYFREEFVKKTESGKEITNEDLRRIADQAAEKFTDYLCKL